MQKDFQYYIALFKEHKQIFFSTFIAVMLLGSSIIYFMPNKYLSHSKIEITQYQNGNLNDLLDAFKTDQRMNKPTDEAEIIMSTTLVEKAIVGLNFMKKYYIQSGWSTKAIDPKDLPFDINLTVAPEQSSLAFTISELTSNDFMLTVTRAYSAPGVLQHISSMVFSPEVLYKKKHRIGEVLIASKFQLLLTTRANTKLNADHYTVYIDSVDNVFRETMSNLNVTPIIKDSSILAVDYKDSTPQRAEQFVTRLVQEYIAQNLADNTLKIEKTVQLIETQLAEVSIKLQKSAADVEAYQTGNLLLNVPDKLKSVQDEINTLQTEKSGVMIQKNIFEKLLPLIKQDQDIGNIVIADESIMNLIAERDAAISKQRELSAKYTDKHSEMIAVNEKIESMRRMLNDKIIYSIGNLKTREDSINKLTADFNAQVKDFPAKEAHLSELKRQYQVDSDIYQELLRSKLQMTTEVTKAQRYNKIVDSASYSNGPVSPKRLILFVITLMIATMMALIAVLLRDYLTVLISKPNDILKASKIPIFGVLPFIKGNNYNRVYVLDDINGNAAESYRRIRTNLEYTGNQSKGKVILVTSSVPNEGKTTFAANLAVVHGMLDAKVIILNLDLRIPQLHMKFNLQNKQGMSEILAGKVAWNDTIQHYTSEGIMNASNTNVDVITSGAIPPNPAELLNSGRIDTLLAQLREQYDYIIIDSAPFMKVADTSTLTKKADVVLFILRSGHSKIDYLANIEQVVKEQELTSVGCILTAVQDRYLDLPEYDRNYDLFVKGV